MLVLPTQWIPTTISFLSERKFCIYGFISNAQPNGGCSYGFYLTNFIHVWVQELDKSGLIPAANAIGLEDLSDQDLNHLLNELSNDVRGKNISFVQKDDNIIAQTNGQPSWTFSLVKQDDTRTILFLAKLNHQQFSHMSFLKYQIDDLKEVISVKDQYARFLVTNFKQSHGMELINNYKRNNRTELEMIEKFNPGRWEKKSSIEYRHLRTRKKGDSLNDDGDDGDDGDDDELNKNISLAIEEPWKFANLFYLNVAEEQEDLSPVKFEFDDYSQSPSATQSQFSQLQFESQPTLDLNVMESPTKRGRPEFKRPLSSQNNNTSTSLSSQDTLQSQRKRRKIGSLSKR